MTDENDIRFAGDGRGHGYFADELGFLYKIRLPIRLVKEDITFAGDQLSADFNGLIPKNELGFFTRTLFAPCMADLKDYSPALRRLFRQTRRAFICVHGRREYCRIRRKAGWTDKPPWWLRFVPKRRDKTALAQLKNVRYFSVKSILKIKQKLYNLLQIKDIKEG